MARCSLILFNIMLLHSSSFGEFTLGGLLPTPTNVGSILLKNQINQFDQLKGTFLNSTDKLVNELTNAKDKTTNVVSGTWNSMVGTVDGNLLQDVLNKKIPGIGLPFKAVHCVDRFAIENQECGTFTFGKGRLINFGPITVGLPSLRQDLGGSQVFAIPLKFQPLMMEYSWKFHPVLILQKERKGTVAVVQPGPNYVDIIAAVAKQTTVLNSKVNKSECFLSVQSLEYRLGGKPGCGGVFYGSTLKQVTGISVTGNLVKIGVNSNAETFQNNVKGALSHIVQTVLKTKDIFCENKVETRIEMTCVNKYQKTEKALTPHTVEDPDKELDLVKNPDEEVVEGESAKVDLVTVDIQIDVSESDE